MSEMKDVQGLELTVLGKDCYVVHCDRELGITIHTMEKDEPIACLNKKDIMEHFSYKNKNRVYHEAFTEMVRLIKKGEINEQIYFDKNGVHHGECNNSMSECAYSGGTK